MKKRDLVILAAALLFAMLAGFWVLHSDVLQTGSWGLSFREPGAAGGQRRRGSAEAV